MTTISNFTTSAARLEAIADLPSPFFASSWNSKSVTGEFFTHLDTIQQHKGYTFRPVALLHSLERIKEELQSPLITKDTVKDLAVGKIEALYKALSLLNVAPKQRRSRFALTPDEVQEFTKHLDALLPTVTKSLLLPIREALRLQLPPEKGHVVANGCLTLILECMQQNPLMWPRTAAPRAALSLLASFFKHNTLEETRDAANYYESAEYHYHEVIDETPFLANFRDKLFHQMFIPRNPHKIKFFSPKQLQFHLQRKNLGSDYSGQLIINPQSTRLVQIDPTCIQQLCASIQEIYQSKKQRTQHIIYLHGHEDAHSLCLDVQKNSITGHMEMLCMESAAVYSQWLFLQKLTEALCKLSIPYQIFACQAGLQKSYERCILFAFVLSCEIAKVSYDALRKVKPVVDVEFQHTWSIQTKPKLSELAKLPQVTWIPVTAFGEKVIKMGQSITEMKTRLLQLDPDEKSVAAKIEELLTLYGLDREKKIYYMEHRLISLFLKYQKTPGKDLSENDIFWKHRRFSRGLCLRRMASGLGPKREMDFLIERMPPHEINERAPTSGKTALHWAVEKGLANRTRLLLAHNARSDIPDNSGLTAKTVFDTSPLTILPGLKAQFPS